MVYLLEPSQYNWIRSPSIPSEVVRKEVDGIQLQQSDLPAETVVKGRLPLPDICHASDGCLLVSDLCRAALDELTPGAVNFLQLRLKAPEHMLKSRNFFLIDVLPRAQLIDWDRSPTVRRVVRAADGRESRALDGRIIDSPVKFKAVTPDTPQIWREGDVDRPAVHFFSNKMNIFLRDELWEALNTSFSDQLVGRKLA